MRLNKFQISIIFRIVLLTSTLTAFLYLGLIIQTGTAYIFCAILFLFSVSQFYNLYFYLIKTNQKLSRFLGFIKHSDFSSKFSADNDLEQSFKGLNDSFNSILEAFRNERLEKEESFQYLNSIVQHVSTGLIAYTNSGEVELINENAKVLIDVEQIDNIEEILERNHKLYKTLLDLPAGKSALLKGDNDMQLAIHATTLLIKTRTIKLISLQNINSELQAKEQESWHNLTKVLRHEIMNSIAPIASLNSTLLNILEEDLVQIDGNTIIDVESLEDLKEGLSTIGNRAKSLISFIEAYRDYTSTLKPKFKNVSLKVLIEDCYKLMRGELKRLKIKFEYEVEPKDLTLLGDPNLLEMVVINLIKNAIDANINNNQAKIIVRVRQNDKENIYIDVIDNGPGIIQEAIDKIFIPFFTTKNNGSGIGLSISKQIMQIHHGSLIVNSKLGVSTTFTMKF